MQRTTRIVFTNTFIGAAFLGLGLAGLKWLLVYVLTGVGFQSKPPNPAAEANNTILTSFVFGFGASMLLFGLLQLLRWVFGGGDRPALMISKVQAVLTGFVVGCSLCAWSFSVLGGLVIMKQDAGLLLIGKVIAAMLSGFIVLASWVIISRLSGIARNDSELKDVQSLAILAGGAVLYTFAFGFGANI